MSDQNATTDTGTDTGTEPNTAPGTIMSIAVTKSGNSVDVDTSKLPDDVYREALLQGLKVLINRGMSKVTKEALPDDAARKAEADHLAGVNVEKLYSGDVKLTGAKAKSAKASGAVMTEARRLAKNLVKDAMKANGIKISHVAASEITKAANALLEADPSIIDTATKNLADREKTPVAIDITKLIHTDPALVAKAEAKKAADKANRPLSAKQAGKVAPRKKGSTQPQASA